MLTKPDWLKEVFPWEQKSVVVNGHNMAYVDEGGPGARPVLLLHGNPTWALLYRFFIPPLLEAGYRVIAPDWIGSGYSDHPRIDARFSLAHHIADLVALMDQLKLRGFVIVGQDWGGPQGVGAASGTDTGDKVVSLQQRANLCMLLLGGRTRGPD